MAYYYFTGVATLDRTVLLLILPFQPRINLGNILFCSWLIQDLNTFIGLQEVVGGGPTVSQAGSGSEFQGETQKADAESAL